MWFSPLVVTGSFPEVKISPADLCGPDSASSSLDFQFFHSLFLILRDCSNISFVDIVKFISFF